MNKYIEESTQGFTLLETMVSMGIFTVTLLAASSLSYYVQKSNNKIASSIGAQSNKLVTERSFYSDLRDSESNYQLLSVADDNGKNFNDFIPDLPCISNCDRTFTLDIYGRKLFYTFIQQGIEIKYDPSRAYAKGNISANGFLGINNGGYVQAANEALDPEVKSGIKKGVWPTDVSKSNQLFLLNSPIFLRPLKDGIPDSTAVPRQLTYIGTVNQNRTTLENDPGLTSVLNGSGFSLLNTHPMQVSTPTLPSAPYTVSSPHLFFFNLPALAGVSPVTFLKAIKLVRYNAKKRVDQGTGSEVGILTREEYDPFTKRFGQEIMLISPFSKVVFKRKVNSPAITFIVTR